jgi:hypothetical protein
MPTVIVCPSGLSGEIRGLKGKEANLLADRASAKRGLLFDRILSACWLSTTDSGLYGLAEGGALDWGKVLVADRFYTLLQIRSLTFGDEYAFKVQCASEACRERFEWQVSLTELPVRHLSETSKAAFKAGNRFETKLPRDGRRVWFQLQTGAEEVRAASHLRASTDRVLLTALAVRIVEIEGVPSKDKLRFLEEMEMADAAALLDEFDAADGGVETDIEVECPHCWAVQEIRLPFGPEFFLPRSKAKEVS